MLLLWENQNEIASEKDYLFFFLKPNKDNFLLKSYYYLK